LTAGWCHADRPSLVACCQSHSIAEPPAPIYTDYRC